MDNEIEFEWPEPSGVEDILRSIHRKYALKDEDTDVRFRMHNGCWQILWGLSDYDQDHRGYWGASSIPSATEGLTQEQALEIAKELIEQAKDDHAQDQD